MFGNLILGIPHERLVVWRSGILIFLGWQRITCSISSILMLIQVGNRSSEFHPDKRRVRREGSYIYEEFLPTGGTDVKVIFFPFHDMSYPYAFA